MDKILVGSNAFFKNCEGFKSVKKDYIKLIENPMGYSFVKEINKPTGNEYEWKKMSPQEFISYALKRGKAEQLGKFLIPEFAEAINFTIEDLTKLEPLANNLSGKHSWQKVIYDTYIENGSFTLPEDKLQEAYASYKETRGINY